MSLDNVKHIVLVGKGGVGKSSITTQLALSFSLAGHSVGILDIDLTGPSIPRLLGLENAKIKQAPGGWLPCEESNKIGSLHAISLALLLPSRSSAVVWRGPKKTAMVRQFLTDVLWPPTDYLLIDTPPGTSDEHISLAETLQLKCLPGQLAGAVIVTTPQAVAISDVRKEVNFCRKVGVGILGVVENMSGYVCECCGERTNLFGKGGGEIMAGSFEVPFLGSVPVDRQWGVLIEEGKRPTYVTVEDSGEEREDGQEEEDVESGEGKEKRGAMEIDTDGGEEGLLVDRYRSCSLCGLFMGITKQLVGIVEGKGNAAV
ncbi:P-loop containing nucleoside triphosphate hydrolase protein [Usnea florida]